MVDVSKYQNDELVTLREAAAILRVSPRTLTRYKDEGKIPFFEYSRRKFLYRVKDLREFQQSSYKTACDYIE